MFRISVNTGDTEITQSFSEEILISDALSRMGITQHKPCGGRGVCRKCTVLLNGREVLSCRTWVSDNSYVDYSTNTSDVQGITFGSIPEFEKKPLIKSGYAAAIDIGTTTVAGYICKFPGCECVHRVAYPNTQAKYGADVISRIMYSNENGTEELKHEVVSQIKKITDGYNIDKYVITGNTTMLHLLTGKAPKSLAVAPYTPETLFGAWYENAYLPRCISAFVGADITTAILASDMRRHKTALLADIGTNGEIVLWHNGTLTCCSTAAGPAFEGAGISMGMFAASGAISRVYSADGIKYETVDGVPPVGICGSGLIDAIACMKKDGVIDETGYLEEAFQVSDSGVFITPADIRQIQLAKSAIRSGIDALLHRSGITPSNIEAFYIAGGFGSFIDVKSAADIGLIPPELEEKAVASGNCAGIGAAMLLLNRELIAESEHLAERATSLDLSADAYFMEKYIENMVF